MKQIVLVALLFAPLAFAQVDPMDPMDPQAQDSGGVTQWFVDGRSRYERTTLPGRDNIERTRFRLRAGARHFFDVFEIGAAVEGQLASSDNVDNLRNKDNEKSDGGSLDELYARWGFAEGAALTLGKTPLAAEFSPMLWDNDFRPVGVALNLDGSTQAAHSWRMSAAYYAPEHIFDEDTRMVVLQGGYRFELGNGTSWEVLAGYMHFSDLDALARVGLQRTNRRIGTPGTFTFLSDYRLADLQLIGRTEVWNGRPLTLSVDVVKNVGADDFDQGIRSSLVIGDSRRGGWEAGFAYHRVQRDAVLSAFADADWWFQSFYRGGMPWVGFGFTENVRLRLAGFKERRDGVSPNTDRVLLDLFTSW